MGAIATGFVSQLGADAEAKQQQTAKQQRDDALMLRERHADQIQQSINTFQNDPELTDAERSFKIGEAQKQLTALYKPEEGADLFNRLGRLIHHGTPDPVPAMGTSPGTTAAVQTATPAMSVAPGINMPQGPVHQVELHPGMTIDEVLAAGSPAAAKAHAGAAQIAKFKQDWQSATGSLPDADTLEEFARKQGGLPQEKPDKPGLLKSLTDAGLSPEDAQKALRVHYGLDAKPGAKKPMEADIKGNGLFMGVNDPETGKKYSRSDLESGNAPAEAVAIYKDYKTGKGEQSAEESRKEGFSLEKQQIAISAAMAKQDYTKAKSAINKGKDAYIDALSRSNTMDQNLKDAQNGNQQAMLSLVANHIGMTLSAQKGARITRSAWEEAMNSAPWLSAIAAKWFHEDENGDMIFDGYKTGVNLTGDQMTQMVNLAHQKRDQLKQNIDTIQNLYGDDIAEGEKLKAKSQTQSGKVTSITAGKKKAGTTPAAESGPPAGGGPGKTVFIVGNQTFAFPNDKQDVIARFRRKYPHASESQGQ